MWATNDHALSWDGKQIGGHGHSSAAPEDDSQRRGYSQSAFHHEYRWKQYT